MCVRNGSIHDFSVLVWSAISHSRLADFCGKERVVIRRVIVAGLVKGDGGAPEALTSRRGLAGRKEGRNARTASRPNRGLVPAQCQCQGQPADAPRVTRDPRDHGGRATVAWRLGAPESRPQPRRPPPADSRQPTADSRQPTVRSPVHRARQFCAGSGRL